jgi:hypothetical protein
VSAIALAGTLVFTLGAVIGGPFDIPESQLTGMIQRVMDAERAAVATVH